MDTADTLVALRIRRDLTGESFNDGTIEAWADALDYWPLTEVRKAITIAARTHNRISVALVVEQLPPRIRLPAPPPETCDLCDGTGWVDDPQYHSRTCARAGGCHCHGVKPCRCTKGQAMIETQRRIHEANNR